MNSWRDDTGNWVHPRVCAQQVCVLDDDGLSLSSPRSMLEAWRRPSVLDREMRPVLSCLPSPRSLGINNCPP